MKMLSDILLALLNLGNVLPSEPISLVE